MLRELERMPDGLTCILHSFEGSQVMAELAVARGYFIGAGGLLTRSRAQAVRAVLRGVPIQHLLIETDSPYLVPAKVNSQRNEPANVLRVVEALAHLYVQSEEVIAGVTTTNAERVLGSLLSATPAR